MLRVIIIAVFVGCIAYIAARYQKLGTDNYDLKKEKAGLIVRIRSLTGQIDTLQADTARLGRQVLAESNKRLLAENNLANQKAATQQSLNGYQYRIGQKDAEVDRLSAQVKKRDADAAGYGVLPTSVNDSVTNAVIAKQAGQIRDYRDTIVPALQTSLTVQTNRAERAEDRVSDLELDLNGANARAADKMDAIVKNKPFLNIGLGKKVSRGADQIRAGKK